MNVSLNSASTIIAVSLFVGTLMLLGALLARLSRPTQAGEQDPEAAMIEAVNAVLPQTQCAQCGYPGCRPYATAIINEHEQINRCPPGGDKTIVDLAELLGTPVIALNTECGIEKPAVVAVIDESVCIGCTLCIQACPVDAIVGAAKLMHTVISDECTGCELCLPPCPVDCIELLAPQKTAADWQWPRPT